MGRSQNWCVSAVQPYHLRALGANKFNISGRHKADGDLQKTCRQENASEEHDRNAEFRFANSAIRFSELQTGSGDEQERDEED